MNFGDQEIQLVDTLMAAYDMANDMGRAHEARSCKAISDTAIEVMTVAVEDEVGVSRQDAQSVAVRLWEMMIMNGIDIREALVTFNMEVYGG